MCSSDPRTSRNSSRNTTAAAAVHGESKKKGKRGKRGKAKKKEELTLVAGVHSTAAGWTEKPESSSAGVGRGRGSRGRRRQNRAPRSDSLDGEERHGEAELVVAVVCFGAAGFSGELDGGHGELRLDLVFPLGQRTGERGKWREQVRGSRWASSVVFDHQGGTAGRHGDGAAGRSAWHQCQAPLWGRKENSRRTPWHHFS